MKVSEEVRSRRDREVCSEAVQAQLERVLASESFRSSPQHQLLLKTIVNESWAGRTDLLKEVVLANSVFGRRDYDPSRNTQVRVAVNAIRRKLASYYEGAGADDHVRIEIPLGHYVALFWPLVAKPSIVLRHGYRRWIFAASALAALLIVAAIWMRRQPSAEVTRVPVQITFDTGWTAQPAVSRDGSVLVYSSDRGPSGERDIWIQQAGQPPRQLTNDSMHNMTPDVSPDGTRVVFRSWRKEEGIWSISTSGGEAKLVARGGYSPRFSPNGEWIVFTGIGDEKDWTTHTFIVPAKGGLAERVDYGTEEASCAVWSPDGKEIVFAARQPNGGEFDFWIATAQGLRGQRARPLHIQAALLAQNLPGIYKGAGCPEDWIGNRLLFVTHERETSALLQTSLNSSGRYGSVELVPSAIGAEGARAVQGAGKQVSVLFGIERRQTNIWETNLTGSSPLKQLTHDSSLMSGFNGTWPALSGDGTVLGFVSERNGLPDICLKDLLGGHEQLLGAAPVKRNPLLLDGNGSHVVFVREGQAGNSVVLRSVAEKTERVLTEKCPLLHDWSQDGEFLLCSDSRRLFALNAKKPGETPRLDLPRSPIEARFSPDGRWVAFVIATGKGDTTAGFVAPMDGSNKESQICGDLRGWSFHWAPNGNALYYWSTVDSFRCLYMQALDPRSKAPVGDPVAVLHRHESQRYPWSGGTLSVSSKGLAMTLKDELANIWKVDLAH